MPVYRTFVCLNRNCQHEHTSDRDFPPCPRCGGLRSKWLPKPFAISKVRAGIDQTVKELTNDDHKARELGIKPMTNFNTPERDRPARIKEPINYAQRDPMLPFAPNGGQHGFGLNLPRECFMGNGKAYCGTTGTSAPVKVPMGQVQPSSGLPDPTPVFEGRHRPPR
jgi:hypothetical protein